MKGPGSTSYLQVCLVFRSDPQLIPTLFSGFRFGPPPHFTGASAWPWIDHLASGLPYGNSQAHSTKGTPSPSRALTACKSTVSGSLSLPSRGPFHLSLTVLCAIGSCRVFSLGGWSPLLPAGFLVSRRTQDHIPCSLPAFGYRAFTFSRRTSHSVRLTFCFLTARAHALNISYNPVHISTYGLGSSLFARRYWGNLS